MCARAVLQIRAGSTVLVIPNLVIPNLLVIMID
jgi:hypothetical protein